MNVGRRKRRPYADVVTFAVLCSLALLCFARPVFAEFKVPRLSEPVTDTAGMISAQTERELSDALRKLRREGNTQLAVLTVPSLEGLTIEQASIQVVDQWKLGDTERDDGVLLMIAQKERRIRIEVGQGLEGVLTDAYAKRIIDEGMTPLFKSGDIDAGVLVGVYQITQRTNPGLQLLQDTRSWKAERQKNAAQKTLWDLLLFFFALGFLGLWLYILMPRVHGKTGGYYGGGWGGSGYGGGGFGGGGFSGGGGGFSGGGASGGW